MLFNLDDCEAALDLDSDTTDEAMRNEYIESPLAALEVLSKLLGHTKKSNTSIIYIKQLAAIRKNIDYLFQNPFITKQLDLYKELIALLQYGPQHELYKSMKNKVTVGIGGQFSAGKSCFINSVLSLQEGRLEDNQGPTTAIPTYIMQGSADENIIVTKTGNFVSLNNNQMRALTHEFRVRYGFNVTTLIHSIRLIRQDLPYKDIVIVDTPGYSTDSTKDYINGADLSDREIAQQQLNLVDKLIWLIDVDNGTLKDSDIKFLKSLCNLTAPLVVVNKADKKQESEVQAVIEHVKSTLNNYAISYYDVTAYSSLVNGGEKFGRSAVTEFLKQSVQTAPNNDGAPLEKALSICQNLKETIEQEESEVAKQYRRIRSEINKSVRLNNMTSFVTILMDLYNKRGLQQEVIRGVERIIKQLEQLING